MTWIPVSERLPNDRREVFVWGQSAMCMRPGRKGRYLGTSRFNWATHGSCFDIERGRWSAEVTHWAEIVGPDLTS